MNIADRRASARTVTAQTADLTVVGGAGHVGIPLVLSFAARGSTVNVNDTNEQTLATLEAGRVAFIEDDARRVSTTDPFVKLDPDVSPLDEVVAGSDIPILSAPHSCYRSADLKSKPVVDVWGILEHANVIC